MLRYAGVTDELGSLSRIAVCEADGDMCAPPVGVKLVNGDAHAAVSSNGSNGSSNDGHAVERRTGANGRQHEWMSLPVDSASGERIAELRIDVAGGAALGDGARARIKALVEHAAVAMENARTHGRVQATIARQNVTGAPREDHAQHWQAVLRRSEEHRRIVDSLPAAVYICDVEGRIQMYNEAAVALWGRRPEIGVERWCGSHRIFTSDGTLVRAEECRMAVAIRENRPVPGDQVIIEREDGTRRHVLPHPEPLRDSEGRLVGAINMLVDVTEQHRAAEAQSLLAAIVDSSGDAIVSKTLEGRITSWNAGAQRTFGYTPGEAIGKHVTMLIPRELWGDEEMILARLRRGERIDHFETRRLHKDGHIVHVSITISPVRDASGRIIGASKVARDITSRKRHEEEIERLNAQLREHVRELETLLNVLPIGVFIAHDPLCKRITSNAAGSALLRLPSPDANASRTADEPDRSKLTFRVFREGREVPDEDLPMQRSTRTGEVISGEEYEVVFDDGATRYLYEFATPLLNAEGRIRGCIAAFIDITERKRHEAQMRLVMAELNHRVKNTLAVVDATAQQTLRHTPDMQAFSAAFSARLRALAQAHGLLTQTDWQGAELTGLALAELRSRVADMEQIILCGPAVVLRPNAALALHMVLHELSTNAAKYGALSAAGGVVRLEWRIVPDQGGGAALQLTWTEAGGPPVSQPSRRGFGTKVLTRTIAHELQGTVSMDFAGEGLRCVIRFPWTGRVGFMAAAHV